MKFCSALVFLIGAISNLTAAPPSFPGRPGIDLSRLVVVGDSLSAGVQNFSLLDTQQPNGYASVIARQAGVPLTLPLVPFPGAPNVLQVVSLSPVPVIQPVAGSLPFPRDNPDEQPTNVSVPGVTVAQALTLRPSPTPQPGVPQWATLVLGFPSLLQGSAPTEIELAASLHPTTVIEWLGNNDALVPALIGQLAALTPIDQFAASYQQVLDKLSETGARIITANIPDVTEVGYFTSVRTIAAQANAPVAVVADLLGIGPNDYVRPTAQAYVDQILTGAKGPLPAACPAPLSDLGVASIPCVLTAADASTFRSTINCYNLVIAAQTFFHGGVMVDIHSLVNRIYANGYQTQTRLLSADFFGGLFSLDGIHPTNTGYGVIANEFIRTINATMHSSIPAVNIDSLAATDPLMQYYKPGFTPRQVPPPTLPLCLVTQAPATH